MKRLLFTLICVLATGFSIAANSNPDPPPIFETTTFSELEKTNAEFVSKDWNVVDVFQNGSETGIFVLIKYENVEYQFVYCSDIISDFTVTRFGSFKDMITNTSERQMSGCLEDRWQYLSNIKRTVQNGSSGGLSGKQVWVF